MDVGNPEVGADSEITPEYSPGFTDGATQRSDATGRETGISGQSLPVFVRRPRRPCARRRFLIAQRKANYNEGSSVIRKTTAVEARGDSPTQ